MNKSNSGANTNTLQMIVDVSAVVTAYAIACLLMGAYINKNLQLEFFVVISVFILIFILSNN